MIALCLPDTREGRAARRGERDVVKLTTAQVAERLGVTPRRVRALIAAGRLTAANAGRDYLVDEKDLARFRPQPPGRPPGKD